MKHGKLNAADYLRPILAFLLKYDIIMLPDVKTPYGSGDVDIAVQLIYPACRAKTAICHLTKKSTSDTIPISCGSEFLARSLNRVSLPNWPENQFKHESIEKPLKDW